MEHHKIKYPNKYPLKIEHSKDNNYKKYTIVNLPTSVDLRSKCPPIYDQGQLGSCTANALVGAYQFDNLSFYGSRLFLYYNERVLDNDVYSDAGSTLSEGINALKKYGLCLETEWPYNISLYRTLPSINCYTDAYKYRGITANQVSQNLTSFKQCLASGFPFVFGFTVYSSFESEEVAQTGIVPMPDTENEQVLGGHAVVAVGYDDETQCFIVRNSWGTNWGDNGYFYMPYDYITNPQLASDAWEITNVVKN